MVRLFSVSLWLLLAYADDRCASDEVFELSLLQTAAKAAKTHLRTGDAAEPPVVLATAATAARVGTIPQVQEMKNMVFWKTTNSTPQRAVNTSCYQYSIEELNAMLAKVADEQEMMLEGDEPNCELDSEDCSCNSAKSKNFDDNLEMLSQAVAMMPFCDCAIVGSAPSMLGSGLGTTIDQHETVIRINRLPLPEHSADFGQKTDIFFADPGFENHQTFSAQNGGVQKVELMSKGFGDARACSIQTGGSNCSFSALFLKGADQPQLSKLWHERFPMDSPGWVPSQTSMPFGFQKDKLNINLWGLLNQGTPVAPGVPIQSTRAPTNGFHAFMTFAPICKKTTLYGFSGNGTFDGHFMDPRHNLDFEHGFMDRVVAGHMQETDFFGKLPVCKLQKLGANGCVKKV